MSSIYARNGQESPHTRALLIFIAINSFLAVMCSSLRPGTITSWQKLKDMLVTSFQGFQTKPVTAQALCQRTQDHEEYLQAYV
jgi:hypothetical protein